MTDTFAPLRGMTPDLCPLCGEPLVQDGDALTCKNKCSEDFGEPTYHDTRDIYKDSHYNQ